MVGRAHAAWTHGPITGILLTDIKAAFQSVAKGRLLNLMKVSQIVVPLYDGPRIFYENEQWS
jgi:hypothetical protein